MFTLRLNALGVSAAVIIYGQPRHRV